MSDHVKLCFTCLYWQRWFLSLFLGWVHTTQFPRNRFTCISELHELSTRCILKVLRIVCIPLSFFHFRPINYASCVHLDASKLNMVNLSKRCVQLGAIRFHLKMHAMVARKLHGNCVVWTQPYVSGSLSRPILKQLEQILFSPKWKSYIWNGLRRHQQK